MFDIKSLTGVVINDFDVNFSLISIGLPTTLEVWTLNSPGSYLGNQNSNANWTMVASLPNFGATGTPTNLGLNLNVTIPAGQTQAFYITTTPSSGLTFRETPGIAGNVAASNADIELLSGHGGNYFTLANSGRTFNGNIYYTQASSLADDLQLASIIAPINDTIDCAPRSATETVTVEVRNLGMNAIPAGTTIAISFQVNGGPLATEFLILGTPMATGGTRQYTFTATADLSALGNHTITTSILYGPDLDPANDSLALPIGSGGQLHVTSFPFLEDFTVTGVNGTTELPIGFINESTDSIGMGSDWLTRNDATPTSGTGPSADNTTGTAGMGGYVYVDDDGAQLMVNMRSPCFVLNGLTNPNLRFFMHSLNSLGSANENMFSVDVITYPLGTIMMDVFGPQGQTGAGWTQQAADLSPFIGQTIQLVFRAETVGSTGNSHDLALDDISIVDLLLTPGQAPQPGLAVLDINDCRNPNFDPLQFGFGGPYFTSVTTGDTLVFRMEGQPSSSILLLGGPLNPAAAGFPNIGQLDLGGAVDPLTGIPTMLTVIADGSMIGGFNPFFNIATNGVTEIGFSVPNLPLGVLGNFQCVMVDSSTPTISISNAVQITVQ